MRLNEQRDTLVEAIEDAGQDLVSLRAAILRKMAAPYGDGSRSNMINAETDVLPRLTAILDALHTAVDSVDVKRCRPRVTESVRIW
jgi:hypothetical protein